MKAQRSIVIKSAPDKIWPFIVEPEHIKRWCQPVIRIDQTSKQTSGLGSTFYFEEKAMGRLLKMHFVVTEWQLHQSVAFQLTKGNVVKAYEQRYTLEKHPHGFKVTCFENVKFPLGLLGKIAGMIRKPVTEAHLRRNLASIKIMCETC
jgi:hypothetical protein